jgi:hypothetical protein
MEVSRVTKQNDEIYAKLQIKKLDKRQEELRQEERNVKQQLEINEQKRLEMNRQMNRAGQNVDKLA